MVKNQTPQIDKKGISMIDLVRDIILTKYQKHIKNENTRRD